MWISAENIVHTYRTDAEKPCQDHRGKQESKLVGTIVFPKKQNKAIRMAQAIGTSISDLYSQTFLEAYDEHVNKHIPKQ